MRDFILEFDIRDEGFKIEMKGRVNTYERNEKNSEWFSPENNVYYRINPDEVPLSKDLFYKIITELVEYLNEEESW